jgi:hypothetical protein
MQEPETKEGRQQAGTGNDRHGFYIPLRIEHTSSCPLRSAREQLKAAAIPATLTTNPAAHQLHSTETQGKAQTGIVLSPIGRSHLEPLPAAAAHHHHGKTTGQTISENLGFVLGQHHCFVRFM